MLILRVQRSLSGCEIGLHRLDDLRSLGNLPATVEEEEYGDTNVGGDEVYLRLLLALRLSKARMPFA